MLHSVHESFTHMVTLDNSGESIIYEVWENVL